ncbi:hypothetical protein I656_03378 [Geobacillus sp. WSUCF1]|nr:hypothetical protein I656_03378 [Geobacillus sp. WSUCF1]
MSIIRLVWPKEKRKMPATTDRFRHFSVDFEHDCIILP